MTTLADNRALLLKVKFPMELFILTRGYTALINLGYSLVAYGVMLAVFRIPVSWPALFLVPIVGCLFSVPWESPMCCQRPMCFLGDVKHLYSVVLTLWMYCSAIFYPAQQLSGPIREWWNSIPYTCGSAVSGER